MQRRQPFPLSLTSCSCLLLHGHHLLPSTSVFPPWPRSAQRGLFHCPASSTKRTRNTAACTSSALKQPGSIVQQCNIAFFRLRNTERDAAAVKLSSKKAHAVLKLHRHDERHDAHQSVCGWAKMYNHLSTRTFLRVRPHPGERCHLRQTHGPKQEIRICELTTAQCILPCVAPLFSCVFCGSSTPRPRARCFWFSLRVVCRVLDFTR